jgi:hypothetical protein
MVECCSSTVIGLCAGQGWALPARLHSGSVDGKVRPCLEAVHRHTHKHTNVPHVAYNLADRYNICNLPTAVRFLPPDGESRLAAATDCGAGPIDPEVCQLLRPNTIRAAYGKNKVGCGAATNSKQTGRRGLPRRCCSAATNSKQTGRRGLPRRCCSAATNSKQTSRRAYPADVAALRCDRLELPIVLHRACYMLQLLHRACRTHIYSCTTPSAHSAALPFQVQNAVHCTDLPEDGVLEVEYFFRLLQSYA